MQSAKLRMDVSLSPWNAGIFRNTPQPDINQGLSLVNFMWFKNLQTDRYLTLYLLIFGWIPGSAFATMAVDYSIRQQVGYQLDQFDWNIAGSLEGQKQPNILSELSWENLDVFYVGVDGKLLLDNTLYIRGRLGRGDVVSGENRDSDYCNDNRTGEFSRSNNRSGGYLESSMFGVGVLFDGLWNRNIYLIPQIGLSRYRQYLTIADGQQTVANTCPFLGIYKEPSIGELSGLDSSYEALWNGQWMGVELWWELNTKHALLFNVEYHQMDYAAKARWNLRRDFAQPVSFRQSGNGTGNVFSLTWEYWMTPYQIVFVEAQHQVWRVENGLDTVYFRNGQKASTRLNEVNRYSRRISVGLEFLF